MGSDERTFRETRTDFGSSSSQTSIKYVDVHVCLPVKHVDHWPWCYTCKWSTALPSSFSPGDTCIGSMGTSVSNESKREERNVNGMSACSFDLSSTTRANELKRTTALLISTLAWSPSRDESLLNQETVSRGRLGLSAACHFFHSRQSIRYPRAEPDCIPLIFMIDQTAANLAVWNE